MKSLDLIKKYPDIDPQILSQYKEPQKFIIFNDDQDLHKIKVDLPECPEYHKIDGFGLPAKEQKFQRPILPEKLVKLQKRCETLDEAFATIKSQKNYYKEEIKFIRKQWYRMLNGYWFFNHGVPTYIDGWHYMYVGWWEIDEGPPRYRSRDRLFFIFARFCYTTTMAYYQYRIFFKDKYLYFGTEQIAFTFCKQNEIPYDRVEVGEFFVDKKKRTCYGFIYGKYRREGATYKTECINYCIIIIHENAIGGIQSMSESHARDKVYINALLEPWKRLPFFFKPNYSGSTDPQSGLKFSPPPIRLSTKGSRITSPIGLQSIINYDKGTGAGYDGSKLLFHHHDEVGKLEEPLNLLKISRTVKQCLSLDKGLNIVGLGIKTTTVELMDPKKGGPLFKQYCEMCKYEIRDLNGQTESGFYILFIPTEDGIVEDEYGNSVIEDPTEPTYDRYGNEITEGGRTLIKSTRSLLISQQRYEELASEKRQFPNKFKELFTTAGTETGLPIGLVQFRLEELLFNNPTKVQGNFYWVEGKFGGRVEFEPDPLGKWFLSMRLKQSESNKRFWDSDLESWIPGNKNKFVLGIDPFRHKTTNDARKSKGAGATFYKHDSSVDPELDFKSWVYSNRFVCTYSNRTWDKYTFFEDMLMQAVYFGSGVYPEMNIGDIWDFFEDNHFGEYMIFKFIKKTQTESKTPGDQFGNNSKKDEMFTEYSTHLYRHCHREVHDELLTQIKDIQGVDDIRNKDLFAAGGWALIGAKSAYDYIEEPKEENDLKNYFPQYNRN
jgi:hypothetical protein